MSVELLMQAMRLFPIGGITTTLAEITLESIKNSQKKIEENADIDDLQAEVSRQEVINKISAVQARALQELAIAKRIETAEEVEIEEFYEGNGEGGVGLNTSHESIKIGAHGSGSKISRRIYRFKGFRDGDRLSYEQIIDEVEKDSNRE